MFVRSLNDITQRACVSACMWEAGETRLRSAYAYDRVPDVARVVGSVDRGNLLRGELLQPEDVHVRRRKSEAERLSEGVLDELAQGELVCGGGGGGGAHGEEEVVQRRAQRRLGHAGAGRAGAPMSGAGGPTEGSGPGTCCGCSPANPDLLKQGQRRQAHGAARVVSAAETVLAGTGGPALPVLPALQCARRARRWNQRASHRAPQWDLFRGSEAPRQGPSAC